MNEQDKAQKEADKAQADVAKADAKATEAQAKFDEKFNPDGTEKPKEQLAAEKAAQDADDARAKAAETAAQAERANVATTVSEANVLTRKVDADADLGDHLAQKFGNDPANPKPAPGIDPKDADTKTVRMTRKTPDLPEGQLAEIWVHPDMKGDYARAGWNEDR